MLLAYIDQRITTAVSQRECILYNVGTNKSFILYTLIK